MAVNQCVPDSEADNACATTYPEKWVGMLSGNLEFNVLVQRKKDMWDTYVQELALYHSWCFCHASENEGWETEQQK